MGHRVPTSKLQRSGSFAEALNIQRKTCADVIRESKILINYDGLKSVLNTKRPETPLEDNEGYDNWKRIKSGDALMKKTNICFTPTPGKIEFEFGSRPPSSFKKLDPLPIDRKVHSASSSAKAITAKRERKLPKPVEAFQNFSARSSSGSGRNVRKENKLRRDFSLEEIKGCPPQNFEVNFVIEGKKCESTSPPKKSRQTFHKHQHGNLTFQEYQPKQPNQKKIVYSNLRDVEDAKVYFSCDASNIKKESASNVIKINVKIPTPQVSPPPVSLHQSVDSGSPSQDFDTEVASLDSSKPQTKDIDASELGVSDVIKSAAESLKDCKANDGVNQNEYAVDENDKKITPIEDDDDDDEGFILMMLEDLKLSSKVDNAESLKERVINFHDKLQRWNLLGKNSRHRSKILKFIITLIDFDCPSLILNVCKLMLSLKVSGGNMLNVTKLLVKLSNDKANGKKFADENMIDTLLDTISCLIGLTQFESSTDNVQSLLNLWTAIKSLTTNSAVVKLLPSDVMIETLSFSYKFAHQLKSTNENNHVKMLVLLTATTRNLLDVSHASKILINAGLIENLFDALDVTSLDESVTMNVVRILSKLTMQNECCLPILDVINNMKALNNVLQKFYKHEDIVLRVTFALGNMAAKHDKCRLNYLAINRNLSVITQTYNHFLELATKEARCSKEVSISLKNTDNESVMEHLKKSEDVLVKVLRLLANLTISEEVGLRVVEEESCVLLALDTLEYDRLSECDELLTNVLALLNNLSFYVSPKSALMKNQERLIKGLMKYLATDNFDCLAEVIRVVCNMSRDEETRNNLATFGVDRFLLDMLDSGSNEIIFSACGALINFMADPLIRISFSNNSGIERIIGVLEVFASNDWQLAGMACQILCNYCLGFEVNGDAVNKARRKYGEERNGSIIHDGCCSEALFLSEEIQRLKNLLHRYLAKPPKPVNEDRDMEEYFVEVWRSHFVHVAQDLLEKLNNYEREFSFH